MISADALHRLVDGIPRIESFYTLEELSRRAQQLVCDHPDSVEMIGLGKTRSGRPLACLRIGRGPCRVVACGAPHPNEPVGCMTLSYLAETLAEDPALCEELGCTWYIVTAWDADGLALNEGWLHGPFTLFEYARHYFRPTFSEQPDWTFPVRHKGLVFDRPTPEAEAVRTLIDDVAPDVMLSLHNCSFGGAYWYETEPTPEIWESLLKAAQTRGIPVNLSTPEMPYARLFAPAVFRTLDAETEYDYYESLGASDPSSLIRHGTTSASYAARRHGTLGFVCEIPYFIDPKIGDGRGCGRTLRDVTADRLEAVAECGRRLAEWMSRLGDVIRPDSPYRLPLITPSFSASDSALGRQAAADPAFNREASVAEEFEACVVRPYYRSRNVGMLLSAIDYERARGIPDEAAEMLAGEVAQEAEDWLRRECDGYERASNYRSAAIEDLVAVQTESLLLAIGHAVDASRKRRKV